ncbi:MAG: Cof-type HAD-IIB family hydrolase [Candidatus Izemoplasmatales bacterium]|jgi:hypothetical protein|nr:Cof-type HAD-IIB family hydrolase [Candidatus Izemoplasmatales bacterium]
MIKLIATDLDGTLLNGSGKLSHRTIEVFEELKNKHCYIVIASGRTSEEIIEIVRPLGLVNYDRAFLIAYNGVSTVKTIPYQILDELMLKPNQTKEIIDLILNSNMKVHIFARNKMYISQNIEYILKINTVPTYEVTKVNMPKYQVKEDIYKVLVYDEEKKLDLFKASLDPYWFAKYHIFKSSSQLLEFVHKQGSKGDALKRICNYLDICPSEVLAFGDEENDISMIEYAEVGVAMANAKAEVKDKAKIITLSNEFDGVAEVIKHYVLDRGDE